jgi:hypothetical protein
MTSHNIVNPNSKGGCIHLFKKRTPCSSVWPVLGLDQGVLVVLVVLVALHSVQ